MFTYNNKISQYVGLGQTKKGDKQIRITISKEDFLKHVGNEENISVYIYPENEPRKDKNGNDYIFGTVKSWTKK